MIKNSKGHLMKTCIRLAFLSTMLLVVPAQGSQDLPAECPIRCEAPNGDKLPPVIGGVCLSHYISPWQMVNDVLILQPDKNTRLTAGQAIGLFLSTTAITAASAIAGGWLKAAASRYIAESESNSQQAELARQYRQKTTLYGYFKDDTYRVGERDIRRTGNSYIHLNTTSLIAAAVTGFFGGRGIYRALRKKALENAQRAQMDLIVTWWHDVHAYFPEEVHNIFDELAALKARKANEYGVSRDKAYTCIIEMLKAHNAKLKKQVFYFPWVKDGITRKGQKKIVTGMVMGRIPVIKPEDQVIDYPETV